MRPQPAAAISPARNSPRPPVPPVTTYAPSGRKTRTCAGGTTATLLALLRDVEHHLAAVPRAADQADGRGRVAHRVVRGGGHRQHAVGGLLVDGGEQTPDRLRVAVGHQRQVDGVQREVAPEREEPEPGVAVDVALADLDEPPAEGQQLEAGPLGGTGDRVEHDVDPVAARVPSDLVGERGAARVVDVLDTHVVQQLSPMRATRGRDRSRTPRPWRSRWPPDRRRRSPSGSAPCRSDEILARSCRPYQAVADAVGTAAASASGISGGSVIARRASHVTNVLQHPLGDIPPT